MTTTIPPQSPRPVVWTIAGNDSGGGAGVQADARALAAMNTHGCSVIAALTAQNSVAVTHIEAVSATMLQAQLAALAADMPPTAIKTGMLGSADNVRMVAQWVHQLRQQNSNIHLIVDPVLKASTGALLANDALVAAYQTHLLPLASLVTPNRQEAAALLGQTHLATADVAQAAQSLLGLGCQAVVITGGDESAQNPTHSHDYMATPQAQGWLTAARVNTPHHHGTGCVFASSAAAAMAHGHVHADAIILAKMATRHALEHAYAAGQGAGPVYPQPNFAHQNRHLPTLTAHNPDAATHSPAFAALTEHHMGVYAVVDSADWVERVLAAGVRTVQLRIKHANHEQLQAQVRQSIQAAQAVGAQLFINDHWQLALQEGAYGVHLGQEDLETADLPLLAQSGMRLGLSTHSMWEVCRALAWQPSYIACGPVHATQSKDMPWLPQGNGNVAYFSQLLQQPVVAIAGMNVERVHQAAWHGAAGVALISAITAAPNPEQTISQLIQAEHDGRLANNTNPIAAPAWPQPTLQQLAAPCCD